MPFVSWIRVNLQSKWIHRFCLVFWRQERSPDTDSFWTSDPVLTSPTITVYRRWTRCCWWNSFLKSNVPPQNFCLFSCTSSKSQCTYWISYSYNVTLPTQSRSFSRPQPCSPFVCVDWTRLDRSVGRRSCGAACRSRLSSWAYCLILSSG